MIQADLQRLIRSTLRGVDMWSREAEILLLGTAAVETGFEYIYQMGSGPARSFWQVEPDTAYDICVNFLSRRKDLSNKIIRTCHLNPSLLYTPERGTLAEVLEMNMSFAIIMARLVYWRNPAPLPVIRPLAMGEYWKQIYNTSHGAGTLAKFIAAWERYGIWELAEAQ